MPVRMLFIFPNSPDQVKTSTTSNCAQDAQYVKRVDANHAKKEPLL